MGDPPTEEDDDEEDVFTNYEPVLPALALADSEQVKLHESELFDTPSSPSSPTSSPASFLRNRQWNSGKGAAGLPLPLSPPRLPSFVLLQQQQKQQEQQEQEQEQQQQQEEEWPRASRPKRTTAHAQEGE